MIYDSTALEGDGEGAYVEVKAVGLTDPDEILAVRRLKKVADYKGSPDEFLSDVIR